MQFLRLPSKRGGCGLPFPAAAASLFGATSVRDTQIARTDSVRRSANGKGGLDPSRRDPRATTVRLYARLLPGRPRGIAMVRGDRLPSRVRPHRCTISDMAHGALVRCISPPAAIRSRRGTSVAVFRARAGFPRQTPRLLQARPASRTTGFPDNGRSAAVYAELLRRAQDMP